MRAGVYDIPFQNISLILLGPGSTISHDALRLLARHGTGLVAVGEGGVRMYTAQPLGPNDSVYARRQMGLWANKESRLRAIRRMYAWRLGEILPAKKIEVLRGIEGARVKESYALMAKRFGIKWKGRRYDRKNPEAADTPNQAINHAATAVEAAACVAVAATGTIPQLGFIHEDSSNAFCLDIADLFREEAMLSIAFEAVNLAEQTFKPLESTIRFVAAKTFKEKRLISRMIDRIKELLDDDYCD